MLRRRLLIPLTVVLLLAVGTFLVWRAAPRLVEVSPSPGSTGVSTRSSLRLTFSQLMRSGSVEAHLSFDPERRGRYSWEGHTLTFTPDQPWPSGTAVHVRLKLGGRAASLPGLPLLHAQSWTFTTGQTLLAYLWPASDQADLYALDPESGEVLRLTQTAGVQDFSISPDRGTVYFSTQNGPDSRLYRLALSRLTELPAQPEQVLDCPQAACRLPQLSPDGSRLAYERTPLPGAGQPELTQVMLLSMEDGSVSPAGNPVHSTRLPKWSHRGWLAFYDGDQQAFLVLDPYTRQTLALPNQTGEPGDWSPDGQAYLVPEIMVEAPRLLEARASSHLLRFDLGLALPLDPVPPLDLTHASDLEDTSPAYSPDGRTIAFARKQLDPARWTPGRQLWLMAPDGSQARPLTDDPLYNHYDFAWSADGHWLAYVRFNQTTLKDPPELWMIASIGSDPVQLVIGGYAPKWIP